MNHPPITIKIGGSLLNNPDQDCLRKLARTIQNNAHSRPIYIVAGGGPFADAVRQQYSIWGLRQETAHFMAIAAMDQFAYLMHELIPGSDISQPCFSNGNPDDGQTHRPGAHVLLLAHYMHSVPESVIPRNWRVTSDSLAAYVAKLYQCEHLLLLKSADFDQSQAVDALDENFCHMLPLPFTTWLLNGRKPEQLQRWFGTGHSPSLCIPPGKTIANLLY